MYSGSTIPVFRVEHKLLILLLGASPRPVPSRIHIHKELFVLTRVFPKLSEVLEFEPYYKGPFSRVVQEALRDLIERGYVIRTEKGYTLTEAGWRMYDEITKRLKRKDLIDVTKSIREQYDKLAKDELLLLVYVTYPEYTVESEEISRVISRAPRIIAQLYLKGMITERGRDELREKIGELKKLLKSAKH